MADDKQRIYSMQALGDGNPLNALRDIQLPDGPPWWPPAPGWWLLIAAGFACAIWGTDRIIKRRLKKTAFRRSTLAELKRLRDRAARGESSHALLAELSQLVRMAAVKQFPNHPVAGLIDQTWLIFLDNSGACQDFSQGIGKQLLSAPYRPYQPHQDVDVDSLCQLVERWVVKIS